VKHLLSSPKFRQPERNKNKKIMSFEELPELLTIKDVTHLLNVHANTLRNWEKEGLIQVIRIGPRKDRRYKKDIIQKMMYGVVQN
jgi:hypothetical protein